MSGYPLSSRDWRRRKRRVRSMPQRLVIKRSLVWCARRMLRLLMQPASCARRQRAARHREKSYSILKRGHHESTTVSHRHQDSPRTRPAAHRAGRHHCRLQGRPRRSTEAPQRGARHRDRLRTALLRYKRHYFMASGINAQGVAAEFLQHANEEQAHADQIAARIVQLGGEPDVSPDGLLTRSHSEYVDGTSLVAMIQEDLVAERVDPGDGRGARRRSRKPSWAARLCRRQTGE